MFSYWNTYSFTHPLTADGKPTRYILILSLLNKCPLRKCELLDAVWFNGHARATKNPYAWRGYMSSLFSAMNHFGIASYSAKTRKWSITEKGRSILESAKSEWGKRFAERLWNHNIDDLHIFHF